ncbi:MAG: dTMP kinase [Bradymonadales bacterium]|nr:MAG: dTMP kinase [Bradymonadales bacterium]
MNHQGLLVSFEGGEAVGKSTQIKLLFKALKKKGYKVYLTREPGGTRLGEKIRKLVKTQNMSIEAELFLIEASRSELVDKEILPRLKKSEVVLCDRFQESSLVYQSLLGGIAWKSVKDLNQLATQGLKSDLVVWLDLPEKALKGRLRKRSKKPKKDKFDSRDFEFHSRLLRAYRKLAAKQKSPPIKRFRADQSETALHKQILKEVEKRLKSR